jgi:hypothetical protein
MEMMMYRDWLNYLRGCGVRVVMGGYSFECVLIDPSVIDAGQVRGIARMGGMWVIEL